MQKCKRSRRGQRALSASKIVAWSLGRKQVSVRSRYLRNKYKKQEEQAFGNVVGERGRGNSEERRASQEARSVIIRHLNFTLAKSGILRIAYPVSPFQPRYSLPLSPIPSLIRIHLDSFFLLSAKDKASGPMHQMGISQLEEDVATNGYSRR